jgi:hypothetical protein
LQEIFYDLLHVSRKIDHRRVVFIYLFIYFSSVKNKCGLPCKRRCLGKFLKCVRELSHQLPESGGKLQGNFRKESRGARNKKVMKGVGGGRKDMGFLITR